MSLSNLANAYVRLGEFDQAVPFIGRQEALATANGYRSMLLLASLNRAELARHRGQLGDAAALYAAKRGGRIRVETAAGS